VRFVAAILIKKYGNRRLYDTGDSRYITLEELATKIRMGADVRVVDAQTGDDLTQQTLAQLVLETGNAAKFLPVQLLTQMIRLSDDALAEFFSRYVTGALDLYLQAKRGVQSLQTYNPLAQLPVAAGDALARMWMGGPFAPPYQQPYTYSSGPPYVAPPPDDLEPIDDRDPRDTRDGREPRDRKSSPGIVAGGSPAGGGRGERNGRPGTERGADRGERGDRDDVAAMRRELDELKQAIRDGLNRPAAPARKKRKP
jgi:polyhydroxyalkanoate synthesis repressor PhaR